MVRRRLALSFAIGLGCAPARSPEAPAAVGNAVRSEPTVAHEGSADEVAPSERAGTSSTEALELSVEAVPVRMPRGWGLDLTLHAHVAGSAPYIIGYDPAPHLQGTYRHAHGERSAFADGCRSARAGDAAVLGPHERRSFSRRWGNGTLEAVEPGQTLTLHVGLCNVGLPDGRWADVPAATVVVEVPGDGPPSVRIVDPQPVPAG